MRPVHCARPGHFTIFRPPPPSLPRHVPRANIYSIITRRHYTFVSTTAPGAPGHQKRIVSCLKTCAFVGRTQNRIFVTRPRSFIGRRRAPRHGCTMFSPCTRCRSHAFRRSGKLKASRGVSPKDRVFSKSFEKRRLVVGSKSICPHGILGECTDRSHFKNIELGAQLKSVLSRI